MVQTEARLQTKIELIVGELWKKIKSVILVKYIFLPRK